MWIDDYSDEEKLSRMADWGYVKHNSIHIWHSRSLSEQIEQRYGRSRFSEWRFSVCTSNGKQEACMKTILRTVGISLSLYPMTLIFEERT